MVTRIRGGEELNEAFLSRAGVLGVPEKAEKIVFLNQWTREGTGDALAGSSDKRPIDDEMTERKLCPKIILEGTRLTFKTDIAFELNRHPRLVGNRKYAYHSPIVSAEWCGFTNFPWGRGLINFEPQEKALALETYRTWVRLFELQKYYSWIIDRFHISTQAYQLNVHGRHFDTDWIEERLAPLGFRLVFLYRSTESFESARAARLEVSGNPRQYDDLNKFKREQDLMGSLVEQSILPTLRLDISDNKIKAAVDIIADWMVDTGGIWADY